MTITSVIESTDRECRFHLVHDGAIDHRCQKKISEYVCQKGAEVAFHDVPEDFPREFSEHSKWDAAAIYRLALAESLPESVDRVIYLDSDILVRRSLDELMQGLDTELHTVALEVSERLQEFGTDGTSDEDSKNAFASG